jgi:hypothetical protein
MTARICCRVITVFPRKRGSVGHRADRTGGRARARGAPATGCHDPVTTKGGGSRRGPADPPRGSWTRRRRRRGRWRRARSSPQETGEVAGSGATHERLQPLPSRTVRGEVSPRQPVVPVRSRAGDHRVRTGAPSCRNRSGLVRATRSAEMPRSGNGPGASPVSAAGLGGGSPRVPHDCWLMWRSGHLASVTPEQLALTDPGRAFRAASRFVEADEESTP